MSTPFKYCPRCGAPSFIQVEETLLRCSKCDFHFYQNAGSAVGGLVLNDKHELLLTVRAKEPGKGKYGLPGGFVDIRETAEAALEREIMEEVGLKVTELRYLMTFPNPYFYKDVQYFNLDIFFTAKCMPNLGIQKDPEEIAEVEWADLQKVDLSRMAFESMAKAIETLRMREKLK